MMITEEQALEVLRKAVEERKKPLRIKVLPGFKAQPSPPNSNELRTPEEKLQVDYLATLKKLGLEPQGIGLDLRNYPIVPPKKRVKNVMSRQVKQELLRLNPTCAYCTQPAKTVDHVVPKLRGGTNHQRNLVTACFDCNSLKSGFLPKELGWKLRVPLRAFDTKQIQV